MTVDDITRGTRIPFDLQLNLSRLMGALLALEAAYVKAGGTSFIVTSGYRDSAKNAAAGGRPKSAHMTCEAADIADVNHKLREWICKNPIQLDEAGLYMARPETYPTHIHLQTRKASQRIFIA